MKDIKYIRWDFHWVPWVMPKGLGLGVAGGQKFNFQNMVMWHIKLKEMNSSPGYTENVYPAIRLVSLGWGQRVNYLLDFFESVGNCDDAPSNVF